MPWFMLVLKISEWQLFVLVTLAHTHCYLDDVLVLPSQRCILVIQGTGNLGARGSNAGRHDVSRG